SSFARERGFCGWFAPVSWLCESEFWRTQNACGVLPGIFRVFESKSAESKCNSSERTLCPRLQLRGSAGFTPASLAVQLALNSNHARTQYWERAKNVSSKFNCPGSWKSMRPGSLRLRSKSQNVAVRIFDLHLERPGKVRWRKKSLYAFAGQFLFESSDVIDPDPCPVSA